MLQMSGQQWGKSKKSMQLRGREGRRGVSNSNGKKQVTRESDDTLGCYSATFIRESDTLYYSARSNRIDVFTGGTFKDLNKL